MYRALQVARPAISKRTQPLFAGKNALRALSTSRYLASEHHEVGPPKLFGPGVKDPDSIPTDEEQATGLERYQLLGLMEGIDVFDMRPLESDRLGTVKDPIMVHSIAPERIVGCTGSPADSHDTIWINLSTNPKQKRCIECGSVYQLDYEGNPDAHAHH